MAEFAAGDMIGGYRLQAKLGVGGYGQVWRAAHVSTSRSVALKLLHRNLDADGRRRFAREGDVLRRLDHPGTVELLDTGSTPNGTLFIATELVDGRTLDEWLGRGRPIHAILSVAVQVAECVAHAHRHGIVHRDLKPSNVLVVGQDDPIVKVVDFGIAKIVGVRREDATKTGVVVGSPGYMSPEQIRGRSDIGPATDQYSFAVILFELLSGRRPFRGTSALELAMAHLTEPVPPLDASLPPRLRALVVTLLQKDARRRSASMATVAAELRAIRDGEPEPRPSPVRPGGQASLQQRSRRSWTWGVGAALVVLAGFGIVIGWLSNDEPRPLPERQEPPRVSALVAPDEPTPVVAPEAPDCRGSQRSGRLWLPVSDGLRERNVLTYLPKDFDPKRSPVTLILLKPSDKLVSADEYLEYTGLQSIADREGIAVIVPDSTRSNADRTWSDAAIDQAWRDILGVRTQLCVDDVPIVVLGEDEGAKAADVLACRGDEDLAAIAVTGHRYGDHHAEGRSGVGNRGGYAPRPCRPRRPVPYLFIAHRQDWTFRWDGGVACGDEDGPRQWSVASQESRWRDFHRCGDEAFESTAERRGGECLSWADCDVPLESCHVDGGRDWGRGLQREPEDQKCAGPLSESFPHAEVVWDFFEQHAACSTAPGPGMHTFDGMRVYVPRGLGTGKRPRILALLHEGDQTPDELLNEVDLYDLADEQGLVLAAPHGEADSILERVGSGKALFHGEEWTVETRRRAVRQIARLADRLCVDAEQAFFLGHGRGGAGVEKLACSGTPMAGAIIWAHRLPLGGELCETGTQAVPYLLIAPTKDPHEPADGHAVGDDEHPVMSLDEHEASVAAHNRCSGRAESDDLGCRRWECEVAFRSCRMKTGRHTPRHEDYEQRWRFDDERFRAYIRDFVNGSDPSDPPDE